MTTSSRRAFLRGGVVALAGWGALNTPRSAGAGSCDDPSSESLRSSLHYAEPGPDAAHMCHDCAFFSADNKSQTCGHCTIMNGPVSPQGHCDSWSAKS
jgi:hypothetical protein